MEGVLKGACIKYKDAIPQRVAAPGCRRAARLARRSCGRRRRAAPRASRPPSKGTASRSTHPRPDEGHFLCFQYYKIIGQILSFDVQISIQRRPTDASYVHNNRTTRSAACVCALCPIYNSSESENWRSEAVVVVFI